MCQNALDLLTQCLNSLKIHFSFLSWYFEGKAIALPIQVERPKVLNAGRDKHS